MKVQMTIPGFSGFYDSIWSDCLDGETDMLYQDGFKYADRWHYSKKGMDGFAGDYAVECFFTDLRYEKGKVQNRCVVSGRLGLWNGSPTIEPVMCEDLEEATRKCWSHCDDVEVVLEDGVIYVDAMHHDGTNHFEIRPLTARGAQKMLDGEEICVGNHWYTSKYGKYLY